MVDAAEGFAGQQRLAQRVATASVADRVGPGGALRLSASVGRGVVDARTAAWDLTTVRTAADGRLGGWRVAGMAAVGWLSDAAGLAAGDAARSVSTVQADVARDLGDVLRVGAQVERRPFWENGATVRAGIMASGAGAHAELRPAPAWTVQGRASAHALDDGNRRHEAGAVFAWRTSRGDRDLEVRSSSMLFGYRDSSPLYFSPSRFVRSDLEAEVRHWFSRPRSADAPRAFVAGGLGMGIDSREARYGLGSARLSVPLARIWTLEAEGRWVQASAYESSRVGLWLQVGR